MGDISIISTHKRTVYWVPNHESSLYLLNALNVQTAHHSYIHFLPAPQAELESLLWFLMGNPARGSRGMERFPYGPPPLQQDLLLWLGPSWIALPGSAQATGLCRQRPSQCALLQ